MSESGEDGRREIEGAKKALNAALPPLFGKSFREKGPEWISIGKIEFDVIGKVLAYHLILEHYLDKFVEFSCPDFLEWESGRLTFSQKMAVACGQKSGLRYKGLHEGIGALNKIRNEFSHNIESTISQKHIETIVKVLKANSLRTKDAIEKMSQVQVLESFTFLVCSFIAGYCSASELTGRKKKSSDAPKQSLEKLE